MAVYVDTSALAKWYLPESGSDDFAAWIQGATVPTISSLTMVEMRCLLARRRRIADLDEATETRVFSLFEQDIEQRHLAVAALEDEDVRVAMRLMARVADHPLRTLDAIHLAICTSRDIGVLATADTTMAAAAEELELDVVHFA